MYLKRFSLGKILFILLLVLISFCFFSQITTSMKNNYEKEISISYVVLYPDEYLPSLELSVRKIISPSFSIGVGVSEIYFRYLEKMYIPVFADAIIYIGKKKRLGLNTQVGYGFFNHTFIGKYVSGPGDVVVKRKGSYYLSAGPKYSFNINNRKFNCSVNLMHPSTKYSLYIEDIQKTTSYVENNPAINVKIGFAF